MRRLLLCSIAISAMLAGATATEEARARLDRRAVTPSEYLSKQIKRWRNETWRWQRLIGRPLSPTNHNTRHVQSLDYKRWVLRLWKRRAGKAWLKAKNPPHERAWRCIHRHERSPGDGWRTNTGNGYYGGLQMDWSFMDTYGRDLLHGKGTADKWTPIEQMWVAERAFRAGRGFRPWPNTARACGVL